MPASAPFTRLCQSLNAPTAVGRADLHMHSTASDGTYSPTQLVDLAKRCGLAAIAITDHDTIEGFREVADSSERLQIVPGVELSTEYEGREVHLLAYFFDPDDAELNRSLDWLCNGRVARYHEMVRRLEKCGVKIADDQLPNGCTSIGRRHLAAALCESGHVGSIREAFFRYLNDRGPGFAPKALVPLADAIRVVRNAGGLTSCAHPPADLDLNALKQLAGMGLQAVEAAHSGFKRSRTAELKRWANSLGLAITGGSDCHGPDEPRRSVGSCTLSPDEWQALRCKIGN